MSDPRSPDPADEAELERLIEEIVRERDSIEVPKALVEEDLPEDDRPVYFRLKEMSVGQRIKLALRGNKQVRTHLLRDPIAMIKRMVLQNPRLTEEEVLAVAKDRNADKDLLRLIAENREWAVNYVVRLALVGNPKTPLVYSLRFLATLQERDVRNFSRSRNVPTGVATSARRMIQQREMQRRH